MAGVSAIASSIRQGDTVEAALAISNCYRPMFRQQRTEGAGPLVLPLAQFPKYFHSGAWHKVSSSKLVHINEWALV